jgi:hypothetical protein
VIVAESPPAFGKYFYDTTGSPKEPLFAALMLQLGISPAKADGLLELQNRGWVLVDATYQPVDKLAKDAGHDRDEVIARDYPLLIEDVASSSKQMYAEHWSPCYRKTASMCSTAAGRSTFRVMVGRRNLRSSLQPSCPVS